MSQTTTLESGPHKVSIYTLTDKRSGKPYYQVAWTPPGRSRQKCSYAEFSRAEARAQSVLDLMNGGLSALSEVSPDRLMIYETHRRLLGEEGVARALQEYVAKTKRSDCPGVQSAVNEFLAAQEVNGRSVRHIQTLRHHLNRFAISMRKRLDEVGVEEVDAYLGCLRLSAKSRLNHRISISSLFSFGKRKGWLPADRKTAAELTERPKVVREDPEVFTPDEMTRLLKHAGPETAPFLAIAAFAGVRTAEVQRLTWGCWNPEARCITLPRGITKTARRRNVEVEDNLGLWLGRLSAGKNPGEKIVPVCNLHRFLKPVAKAAGVAWKQNGLRHSYASYHLERYSDAARTSKNCGHSVRELETTYLRLISKQQAELWFGITPASTYGQQIE